MKRDTLRLLACAILLAGSVGTAAAQAPARLALLAPAPADTTRAPAPDSTESAPAAGKAATAIEVAAGPVKFSGLVQAWYTASSEGEASTFRLRRAEMKFAGEVGPRARWAVAVDPAKALKVNQTYANVGDTRVVTGESVNQASLLLQDAYVELSFGGLDVQAGQFKLPLSREGNLVSSAALATVERARFISSGKMGLVRDVGVMASGSLLPALDFQLGLFNGVGEYQNSVDSDDRKVVAGRAALEPGVEGLSLGVSGAWSGEGALSGDRTDRLGADLQLDRGALTLRGEVMRGWDGAAERLGYYGLAAYRIGSTLEAAGRYDVWDRDTRFETGAADGRERDYELSLSHLVGGPRSRVQLSYVRRETGGLRPAADHVLLNFQTAW